MSKRKSRRPWISSVGVATDESREIGERDAASAFTVAMFVLEMSDCFAASSSGSQRLSGTALPSNETSPDLERPCGASAVARFVHVITGTIALKGTPATVAFQTAPPPSEMPTAPICVSEISGLAASQVKSSFVSCTSRGPSSPNSPSDCPCPRASHMSEANLVAKSVASGYMSWRLPPSPWNIITAGQPAAGAVPVGSTSAQASFAPSEAVNGGSSCGLAAAGELEGQARAPRARTSRTTRRTTTGQSLSRSRSKILAMDPRPIGVFDSGVGGLTVLHECLVTLPHEDFVYLGDHARLPYGPRPLEEVRGFAREIGAFLEAQEVKLIVVACNTATSAALPQLQEELAMPVIGVISPEAHAAVLA